MLGRAFQVDSNPLTNKAQYWTDVTSEVYFPIDAVPADPVRFSGKLRTWELGEVSLSFLATDPVRYVRQGRHLMRDKEEQILITFSGCSDLNFVQNSMSVTCRKSQYFIELAHHPYQFTQPDRNEMWVLRVPASSLRWHIRAIEKYAPYTFDSSRGVGGLLYDMLRMLPVRIAESRASSHHALGHNIIELLALSLEGNDRILGSGASSVRKAHLARIERYIRSHLSDRDLTPELIAGACGISTSYLHQLFRSSGTSVGRWIRELRLIACDRDLRNPARREGIAEIAYRWGFNDHAQFCRHFKAHFSRTPRESRDLATSSASSAPAPELD